MMIKADEHTQIG